MRYALSTGLAALGVAGILLSRAQAPAEYEPPRELAFFDPLFGCPTAISDSLVRDVAWSVPGDRVVVCLQERDPATGEWVRARAVYPTPYSVLDVAFRLGGRELYVCGMRIEGDAYTDVIERWTFPVRRGGYRVEPIEEGTSIGVPRGRFAARTSLAGDVWIRPTADAAWPPEPERTVLYEAHSGGHVDCLVADPEGRFLLLHDYATGDVSALDLTSPGSSPQLVFSGAQLPALRVGRTMVLHDVEGIGRICRLTAEDRNGGYPLGTNTTPILLDTENDGIFDLVSVYPAVDIARGLTPLGDSAQWGSVVNFGWDWQAQYK